MPNTNFQTFHQMGNAINDVVRQATGRDNVQNIDMDFVTVAQNKRAVEEIITGNPASFVTNSSEPIDYLIVQIDAVQSGSGDPSPENVRPISGWDSVQITRTGKNLLTGNYTWTSGTRDDNGNPSASSASHYSSNIAVQPETEYTLNGQFSTSAVVRLYYLDRYSGWISRTASYSPPSSGELTITFTTPQNCYFINVQCANAVTLQDAQLEKGSVATEHVPFGTTYPITFPDSAGTVYGGTLTVNKDGSGELVVDSATRTFTGSNSESWAQSSETFYTIDITDYSKTDQSKAIANKYKAQGLIPGRNYLTVNNRLAFYSGTDYNRMFIRDSRYATLDALKTGLASENLVVVYELATPVTYNLTALQVVQLLKGLNNVWADTGNVTVIYKNYEEVI